MAEGERELIEQDIGFNGAMLFPSLDMGYVGQSYEINVGFKGLEDAHRNFHENHSRLYGYSMPSEDAEIVNIRLRAIASRVKPEPPKVRVEAKGKPVEYREVLFEEGRERKHQFSGGRICLLISSTRVLRLLREQVLPPL